MTSPFFRSWAPRWRIDWILWVKEGLFEFSVSWEAEGDCTKPKNAVMAPRRVITTAITVLVMMLVPEK